MAPDLLPIPHCHSARTVAAHPFQSQSALLYGLPDAQDSAPARNVPVSLNLFQANGLQIQCMQRNSHL
jgi:hypothetical protein